MKSKLYDNRDDFTFPIVSSNIPAAPAYTAYISLIRYSRVCTQYSDLLDRAVGTQYYVAPMLRSLLCKFYRHHHELVDQYEISISQMAVDFFHCIKMLSFFYHRRHFYRTSLHEYHGGCLSVFFGFFLWGPCCSPF